MAGQGRRSTNGMSRARDRPDRNTALRAFPLEKGDKTEPPIFIIVTKLGI